MRIGELQPGAAWNEAERRSVPAGIIGFFVIGLVAKLSDVSAPYSLGISGAVGFFLAALALSVGYYHRKVFAAQFIAGGLLVLPFALSALCVRLVPFIRESIAITLAGGLGAYLALHRWHRVMSKVATDIYVRQLACDENAVPRTRSQVVLYGAFVILGVIVVLLILTAR